MVYEVIMKINHTHIDLTISDLLISHITPTGKFKLQLCSIFLLHSSMDVSFPLQYSSMEKRMLFPFAKRVFLTSCAPILNEKGYLIR